MRMRDVGKEGERERERRREREREKFVDSMRRID
jgi:hypothetical protein